MSDVNEDSKDITYDENTGMFTTKTLLNLFNTTTYEKDISLTQINDLKAQANKTTMTEDDIDALYAYYKNTYDKTMSRDKFVTTPLKDLFTGKPSLSTNDLLPIAYNGDTIEPFATTQNSGWFDKICIMMLCLVVVIFVSTYIYGQISRYVRQKGL